MGLGFGEYRGIFAEFRPGALERTTLSPLRSDRVSRSLNTDGMLLPSSTQQTLLESIAMIREALVMNGLTELLAVICRGRITVADIDRIVR